MALTKITGGDGIKDGSIKEADLNIDNSPTNDYVLTAKSSAAGGETDSIFQNPIAAAGNITVGTNKNGMVAGPFSMATYTLTIPSGSVFTVV